VQEGYSRAPPGKSLSFKNQPNVQNIHLFLIIFLFTMFDCSRLMLQHVMYVLIFPRRFSVSGTGTVTILFSSFLDYFLRVCVRISLQEDTETIFLKLVNLY